MATLGAVAVDGLLHSPGNVASGHASGNLTLTNNQGTLSLALTGPRQSGLSSLPQRFSYTITAGTGAYTGLTGAGRAFMTMTTPDPAQVAQGASPEPSFNLKVYR